MAQLEQALLPLQDIPKRLSEIVAELASVLTDLKDALLAVRAILEGLIAKVMQVLARLDGLPALFDPVRASIDAALDQIAAVAARVPMFIAQAMGALTMAAGELDQALSLCNNAIEICTRYMTKAPLLIPARALFMGIKALIPGIQSAITAAKGSVQQVGSTAQTGLSQAASTTKLLYPALDSAVAQIKAASATLATLVKGLESSIGQGVARVDGIGASVDGQVKQFTQQLESAGSNFPKLAEQYLQRVPVESTLKSASQKWSTLTLETLNSVQLAAEQTGPKLEKLLVEAEQSLRPKLTAALNSAGSALSKAASYSTAHSAGLASIRRRFDSQQAEQAKLRSATLDAVDREQARLRDVFARVKLRLNEVHQSVALLKSATGPGPGSAHV
jgi:ABC-type transporter Mla subunit MlaD